MSFILEALKKSESKQQQKNGQTVRTVFEPAPSRKKSVRFWGIGFLVLLIFNAGLLLWLFVPRQQESQPVASSTVLHTQDPITEVAPTDPAVTPVKKEQAVPTSRHNQPVEAAQSPVKTSLPVPRSEKKVYKFSQLPTAVQSRIPPLKMSLHAYNRDNSASSMVQLNDHILHEGDNVTDKIRLEKITDAGVILSYDGYRFLFPRRGR